MSFNQKILNDFEEALVIGNGRQGATVFGGIATDKIYLNDLTLWSGEPVNANMNPQAYKNLPAVRKALQEKNYKKAGELIKKLQGTSQEKIDSDIQEIRDLIKTYGYDKIIWSKDEATGKLGAALFKDTLGQDVIEYITQQIKNLGCN